MGILKKKLVKYGEGLGDDWKRLIEFIADEIIKQKKSTIIISQIDIIERINNKKDFMDLLPAILKYLEKKKCFEVLENPKVLGFTLKDVKYKTLNNFSKLFANNKKRKTLANTREEILQQEIENINKPSVTTKKGKGYFMFNKNGEGILIGRTGTRIFRLLQSLCEPHFGVHKQIESIFEAIRLKKDANNSKLSNSSLNRTEKLNIVGCTIKELQKIFKGRLIFRFDDLKRMVWIELGGIEREIKS